MTSDPLTPSDHEDILRKYCLEKEISSQHNHLDKTGQHETDGICDPKELFQSKVPDETKQGLCVCDHGNYSLREDSRTSEVEQEHKCTAGQHNAFDKKIAQALANLHFLEWDGQTRRVNQGQSITFSFVSFPSSTANPYFVFVYMYKYTWQLFKQINSEKNKESLNAPYNSSLVVM